jgi:WD40 repeat protein
VAFVFLAQPDPPVNPVDPLAAPPFLVATLGERAFRTGAASSGDLALSPDGALLASNTEQTLVLLDAKTGAPARWIRMTSSFDVTGLAFSADGARLIAAGWSDHFVLFDVATGTQTGRVPLDRPHALALAASPVDPDLVFTGGLRDARVVWEVPCWSGEHALADAQYIHAAAFSSDGRLLVTVAYGGADLWDVARQRHLQRFGDEDFRVAGAAFSHDGRSIILTGTNGHVARYDASIGHRLADALCPSGNPLLHRPVVTPDGALLLVCREDGKVHLLRPDSLAHVASGVIATSGRVRAVTVARDATCAFVCDRSGRIRVLSLCPTRSRSTGSPRRSLARATRSRGPWTTARCWPSRTSAT